MGEEIKNKIAVVTGGSKGIGFAIAEEFLNKSAEIIFLIDVDENRGIEAAKILNSKHGEGKAVFLKGDVTNDLDVLYNEIIKQYEHIDILVNNVGIVEEISIRRALETNTVATVEWSMKFLKNMRKDTGGKGGTILNIASNYAYMVDEHAPFYKASKFAVFGFTRTLGHIKNYEVTGVRAIVLCPGVTNTTFGQNMIHNEAFPFHKESMVDYLKSESIQEKEDVAKAVVELLANGQTGSAWSIIGGELQPVDT